MEANLQHEPDDQSDLWKPNISKFLENDSREFNDSLQEDFKELNIGESVSEADFQRAYNIVIDDLTSVDTECLSELKILWEMSSKVRPSARVYLMR